MTDYYHDELMNLVKDWNVEQLTQYVDVLEERITDTREQIIELKILIRRKKRNEGLKDTGERGGKG